MPKEHFTLECPGCGLAWQPSWKTCPMCGFSFSDLPSPETKLKEPLKTNTAPQGDIIEKYRRGKTREKHGNTPEVQKAYYNADVYGLLAGISVTVLLLVFTLPEIISYYANYPSYYLIRFLIGVIILSTILSFICVRAIILKYYRHKGYRF